ncbi:MAG: tetratricopeptide repeat protein [Acidobacteria bacterium]|nr:tetratricopeptide repeat protein [Acidobacteriota bacterium]
MMISPTQLQPIKELYNRGLYLRAYVAATQLAPINEWEGTEALLLAGRMAGMLGAPRLMRRLHLRAWREDRAHPEAIYYYARAILDWRGPWRAWMFMRRVEELPDADTAMQSDWYGLKAGLFGLLRDFDAADELIAKAEALTPENPWLWVEKASVFESEDRYEDAVAAAQYSLQLRPFYRPAIQSLAHLLTILDREAEARALLEEAAQKLECLPLLIQLAQLQMDIGDCQAARQNFQHALELSSLLEPEMREWLSGRLAEAAYLCGDNTQAVELFNQAGNGFYKTIAERLAKATAEQKRTQLPVGFIRQHHVTCAPATLTTISRFWQMPAEHLNIAEQICYGGTTDHSERKWAEQNGWVAKEFCVNWEDAVKLIDRGVPFTLATVEPGNAHLQAVIGYDALRGSLLMRDPYVRSLGEGLSPEMLEHYRSTGPRGMALVPKEKASLLNDLDLKEAALYDKQHFIQRALFDHRREEAFRIWQQMSAEALEHRLTLYARITIAWYDDDQIQVLACVEKLLEQFPEDANLKMQKIICLRTLARRSERLEYLKTICEDEKSDPLFWQQLAQELSEDARQHKEALRLLHKTLRSRPLDANSFYQLANIRWSQRQFDEALPLYRFAACLKDINEQYVQGYFIAARHLRRTQEAMEFLAQRFRRFGKRSGFPARTLSWAYEQTGQSPEALDILRQAIELRPDDGELLLYASEAFARHGDFAEAARLLELGEGKAPTTQWQRGAALIAAYQGELQRSLSLWQAVVEAEPLAIDANRNVAQLLAETESHEKALAFVRSVAARFPHSLPIHQMLVDWLRDDPEANELALRHIVEIEPANAWARRELAFCLSQQRRFEEALEQAVTGRELEPMSPYGHCAIGEVHAEMGNFPLARQAFSEAIKLSVDLEFAINELMNNSHSAAERRESLEFIRQELIRQVTYGDGLLAYRQAARMVLNAEEVLQLQQAALDARPDLWHSWSAVVYSLMDLQRLDDALQLARQMTERFPLVPRVWLDLAAVQRARLDEEGLIDALQHALRINPAWGTATQQLAEVHQHAGRFEEARKLMEQAIAYTPLDHSNYGYLADILWQMGERESALERIKQSVTLEPGYDWGWRALREWSQLAGKPELALECARNLTEKRPGQARSYLILAQTEGQSFDDRLQALNRAIELDPRLVEGHSLRARLLTQLQCYDEARAACRPEVYGDNLPPELRCAEAIVDADRGDLPAAVEQLKKLVADEPNYYPAWSLLADWYRASESYADYLNAAQEMVRLVPHRSVPLGYLADAQLLNDHRKEAKETLRYAMTLDPAYEFASTALFDMQLQDYELDAAEETLAILRQQIGGDLTTVRELRLAGKRKNFWQARELLKSLCLSKTDNASFLAQALQADMETNWNATAVEVLNETLDSPQANPNVGVFYVESCEAKQQWENCRRRLLSLPERNELWRRAVNAYLEALTRAGQKHRAREFINEVEADLRAHVLTWGHTGYVLLNLGDVKRTIEWMSDWRNRESVESWMLWNLSLALRMESRNAESREVSLQALSLQPDDLTQAHTLLVTMDELLQGDLNAAEQRIVRINEPTLRDWDRHLWRLIGVVHELRKTNPPNYSAAIDQLISWSRSTNFFGGSDMLDKLLRRIVLQLAKEEGSLFTLLMARAKLLWLSVAKSFES